MSVRSGRAERTRLFLCLLGALFQATVVQADAPPQQASRPAAAGCQWRPFDSAIHGLGLLVQECAGANQHYEFSTDGDWIVAHRPADDKTFGGPGLIKILRKAADEPIEEAIRKDFVQNLPAEAAAACVVRPFVESPVRTNDRMIFEIAPTGDYEKKILAERAKEPGDFGCGPFGKRQGVSYFEYHPSEDPTKFLFVNYGFDAPLFDENSILLRQTGLHTAGKDWLFVDADAFSKIFYDPVSKRTGTNDVVTLSALTDYDPSAQEAESFRLSEKGLSEIEMASFDCVNAKFKSEGGQWFEGRRAEGKVRSAYAAKEKWVGVPEFYLKLFDTVCRQ